MGPQSPSVDLGVLIVATVETRARADGVNGYRLKWRYGGRRGGAPQSVTYSDLGDAKRMKGAVEAVGHLIYAEDPKVVTFSLVTGQQTVTFTAPTFGAVGTEYIDSRAGANRRSRQTYRKTLDRMAPLLGRPIEAVTDTDIRRMLTSLTDAGESVTSIHKLMCSIFKYAFAKGMLPSGNPCARIQAPKKRGRTTNFLTSAEAKMLRAACHEHGKVTRASALLLDFLDVMLATGLRMSEAVGLIADDVHVDNVTGAWIDVTMQLSRSGEMDASGKRYRVSVKTEASERRVVLDEDTAGVLARLVAGKRPTDPVFPDPVTGGWWLQWRVNELFNAARTRAQQAGLTKTPRVHDLRHTHAGWLLTDQVPLLVVSRRLGHTGVKVTSDIYGHLLPDGDDKIRDAIRARRNAA